MGDFDNTYSEDDHWFSNWFQEDYLLMYRHRDTTEAQDFLKRLLPQLVPLPTGSILDLACGAGRYSHHLVKMGYPVIGLDLSQILLKQASEVLHFSKDAWIRADMRSIPLRSNSVSAVFNMFTSFGYFRNDRDDTAVIREASRVLMLGGWLVLDTLNPIYVESNLVPMSERHQDGMDILEERRIDRHSRRVVKTITLTRDGQQSFFTESVRMYQIAELQQMMQSLLLKPKILWGDYQGNPYQQQSPRIIIAAQTYADDPLLSNHKETFTFR